MLILRVACIFTAGLFLAISVLLCSVALIAPWWTPGPTAAEVFKDPDPNAARLAGPGGESDADSPNSEITLWGNVGCAGNESWADICSLTNEAPAIQACIPVAGPRTTTVEWKPVKLPPTTTTALPTLDPNRITTTSPVPPMFACASGGTSCAEKTLPTEDPNRWGTAAKNPGEGQSYGDTRANPAEGGTVTAEEPPMQAATTWSPPTAPPPEQQPTRAPYGEMPGTGGGGLDSPTAKPDQGFFGNLAGSNFRAESSTPIPVSVDLDEAAKPKVATTPAPVKIPGVAEVLAFCQLSRGGANEDTATKFVCQLHSQCDMMSQARNAVIASLGFAGMSGLVVVLFGAGGGGVSKDGKPLPTKHVLGLMAAALSVASALSAGISMSLAAGLDLPHNLDGPGMVCAGTSMATSLLAALFAIAASLLAMAFPGTPEEEEDEPKAFQNTEMDFEAERTAAEQEYPGLKTKSELTLSRRLAWEAPLEVVVEVLQQTAQAMADCPLFPQLTLALPVAVEIQPPDPNVVNMLPQTQEQPHEAPPPASRAAERTLTEFFAGEGAVYKQRFYSDLDRIVREREAAEAAAHPPQDVVPSPRTLAAAGWDVANSPRSGEVYFYSRSTGEVQWEPPFLVPGKSSSAGYYDSTMSPMAATSPSWHGQNTWGASSSSAPGSPMSPPEAVNAWETTSSPTSPNRADWAGMTLPEACAAGMFTPGSATWKKKRSKKTGQVYMVKQPAWASSSDASMRAPSPKRHRGSPGFSASPSEAASPMATRMGVAAGQP